mmetsp:Transcript_14491/g.40194  ORF Transcript_14491/g.40194 Transcript_14491/m.40194 type:complete len:319 (-) Transcript_14491:1251-2207(-)
MEVKITFVVGGRENCPTFVPIGAVSFSQGCFVELANKCKKLLFLPNNSSRRNKIIKSTKGHKISVTFVCVMSTPHRLDSNRMNKPKEALDHPATSATMVNAPKTVVTADGPSEISVLSNRGVEEKRSNLMIPPPKPSPKNDDKDDAASMTSGEQALMVVDHAEKGELDYLEITDLKSAEDIEMNDASNEGVENRNDDASVARNVVVAKHSPKYAEYVLDLEKLSALLTASKSASHQIAGKKVLLLIGGTRAGKTTTALYLAGTEFKEVEVDANDHFEPVLPLPLPESDFAVSGCSKSVTKTIHAVPIKNGKWRHNFSH